MFMADRLTLDAPKRTADGYVAVRARAARTGVYHYTGLEVDPDNAHGLRDTAMVNVLRDDAAVFAQASVRSFLMKPITDNHPTQPVTSANWRDHARGVVAGAMRDGDHLAFDLLLMDEAAISAVDAGKRELSNGYDAKLEFGDFTAADGTKCQARQAAIFGNHVALVEKGRAGETCRIGDVALCDAAPKSFIDGLNPQEKSVKTMLIDGLTVDISNADTALATINTILAARDAASSKVVSLEAQGVTDAATIVAKDAEIAKLTAAVADAKPTLQQLRDAGKAFAAIEGKAKAMGVVVSDAMDETAIMKAVVDKAMPGNAYAADHIAIAFDALTKDVKPADPVANAMRDGLTVTGDAHGDYVKARDKAKANLSDAWRKPALADA